MCDEVISSQSGAVGSQKSQIFCHNRLRSMPIFAKSLLQLTGRCWTKRLKTIFIVIVVVVMHVDRSYMPTAFGTINK